MDMKALCDVVRQTAYDIHAYHAHGHLERSMRTPWSIGCGKSGHASFNRTPSTSTMRTERSSETT